MRYLQVSVEFPLGAKSYMVAYVTLHEHNLLHNAAQWISWTAWLLFISYFETLKCHSHIGSMVNLIPQHAIFFHINKKR